MGGVRCLWISKKEKQFNLKLVVHCCVHTGLQREGGGCAVPVGLGGSKDGE